jgi:hypothetical protein
MAAARGFDTAACLERFLRTVSAPADPAPASQLPVWSSEILPAPLQEMSRALDGQALAPLLGQFLATKQPSIDAGEAQVLAYRRLWFSTFFPDPGP